MRGIHTYKKFRAGLNGDGVSETETAINSINPSTNKVYDIIRYPLVLLAYAKLRRWRAAGLPLRVTRRSMRYGNGPVCPT